jgi:ribulose-5-phosphate 4-epimerase/fuculose-1-phosphate aldolase
VASTIDFWNPTPLRDLRHRGARSGRGRGTWEGGGCLLANHGMLAVGPDPATAVDRTIVMEEVAAAYYYALAVSPPNILTSEQIAQVAAKISGYGQRKS